VLTDEIAQAARRARKRIAVGLSPDKPVPVDIGIAASTCDVVVVGCRVDGYECILPVGPVEHELVDLLLDGRVDGVVRGQTDHTAFVEHLHERRDLGWSDHYLVSLLGDPETEFWLAPVSNTECWIKRHKADLVRSMLRLCQGLQIEPRIALISGCREGDLGPQWYFDGMYYDCEEIIATFEDELQAGGWIRHFGIETERALAEDSNVIVMPNGMVGNQCYRLLVYTGHAKCLVNLLLGCGLNIVMNSRNEQRLAPYFAWAAAVANGFVPTDAL